MPYVTKPSLLGGAGRPESRLMSEYVATTFPDRRVALSPALGPEIETAPTRLTSSMRLKISRPWRPEADALVWLDGTLLLIECKVAEYISGLAKLPLYAALIPLTPELRDWWGWEIRMRLVVPRARPWVEAAAAAVGVTIDLFDPPWLREYYDYRDRYWTAEYRRRRQATLEARTQAGLE